VNTEFLIFMNVVDAGADEHSLEELQDFYFRQKEKLSRKKFRHSNFILRWLIKSWVSRLRLDEAEWLRTFIIRALFVESINLGELSQILGKNETKLRSLALDALLEEVSPSSFYDRGTRDCARNDLYLLDALLDRPWNDSLKIYTLDHFHQHVGVCERCKNLYQSAQAFQRRMQEQKLHRLPDWIHEPMHQPMERSSSADHTETWTRSSWSQIFIRFTAGSGLLALLFLAVIAVPYWRSLLPKERSPVQRTENLDASRDLGQASAVAVPENKLSDSVASVRIPEPVVNPRVEDPTFVPPKLPLVLAPEDEAPKVMSVLSSSKTPEIKTSEIVPPVKVKPVEIAGQLPVAKDVETASQTKIFFRWGVRAQDPDRIAESVLKLLTDVKAQNAGELAFGALYRGGRYFHFTVSKSDYAKLLSDMKLLALTDFSYTSAEGDRWTPADQARVVLWIGPSQ
jgi:hypothetical protein